MSIGVLIAAAVWTGFLSAVLMDVWALLLRRALGIRGLNYALLNRWIGHFTARRFSHQRIATASVIPAERVIGWTAHYAIAISFAFGFLAIVGTEWLWAPTLWPALTFGLATVAPPWLVMQPAMGAGVASSRTPNPHWTRLRNIATHVVFGTGMYCSAFLIALVHTPNP